MLPECALFDDHSESVHFRALWTTKAGEQEGVKEKGKGQFKTVSDGNFSDVTQSSEKACRFLDLTPSARMCTRVIVFDSICHHVHTLECSLYSET